MATYTNRSNTARAARKVLGAAAQVDREFVVTPAEGGFTWAAVIAPEPIPALVPEIVRVPVVSPDGGAAWRALYKQRAPKAEPVEDEEPAEAAPKGQRGKSAALVAAAARPEGITNAQIRAMTGWTKLGGFFGAVKRAGLVLNRKRENGDTRWFAVQVA
jgi:hypothetical protein